VEPPFVERALDFNACSFQYILHDKEGNVTGVIRDGQSFVDTIFLGIADAILLNEQDASRFS